MRSQQYVFNQFLQNQTNVFNHRLQESNKQFHKSSVRSVISNRVLIIMIACFTIVVTVV